MFLNTRKCYAVKKNVKFWNTIDLYKMFSTLFKCVAKWPSGLTELFSIQRSGFDSRRSTSLILCKVSNFATGCFWTIDLYKMISTFSRRVAKWPSGLTELFSTQRSGFKSRRSTDPDPTWSDSVLPRQFLGRWFLNMGKILAFLA